MLKKNQKVNYLGCDWYYMGDEDAGIRLKSISKHLSDIVVPYHRRKHIKVGFYQRHINVRPSSR